MSYILPDHPAIRAAEREGMPEFPAPCCPVCGEECERVYVFMGAVVAGCNNCLQEIDAAKVEDCFPA